jgi:hypothetical protein
MPTPQQIESAVNEACRRLIERDRSLFERDVNERSLSHKFAQYLQDEVDEWGECWDLDCEFNRDARETGEGLIKRLHLEGKFPPYTGVWDEHATTVYPDVIVHKRGPGNNNLLVVEMKKDTASSESIERDRSRKLPAYVRELGYQAAAFVLIRMVAIDYRIEWIQMPAPR